MNYVRELRSLVGHRPLIIAGAAVLISDRRNSLLLQHRQDNHQWGLIGGSMEIGESLSETAWREAKEETGLELHELKWFGIFSGEEFIYEYPNGDVIVNVTAVYTSQEFRGDLKPDKEETNEVRFFPLNELPLNLSPPDKPIIEQYLHQINTC
ncbi:MAG: NUDIX hydrolase [Pleurocapsa sp. MO_192.B19]|nr:NUDIX hydrolase [Pleurocapsa sp. MO_192.B19]